MYGRRKESLLSTIFNANMIYLCEERVMSINPNYLGVEEGVKNVQLLHHHLSVCHYVTLHSAAVCKYDIFCEERVLSINPNYLGVEEGVKNVQLLHHHLSVCHYVTLHSAA
eukprot:c5292_g1_i1 orf=29-361(+)